MSQSPSPYSRILVTGAAGQLGRDICRQLNSRLPEVEVVAASRKELDLTSKREIHEVISTLQPGIVINCAAYTAVDAAEDHLADAELINTKAPGWIGSACRKIGARVIHISTDYVFDGNAPGPRTENDETAPLNIYGKTKLAGEQELLHAQPESLILRSSWLYAAHGHNFVQTMLRLGREKDSLRVVDDQVSSPTYTLDLANAIISILSTENWTSGIFHFSNAGETSWCRFAMEIMRLSELDCKIIPTTTKEFGAKAPRPLYSKLDCGKLKRIFHIESRHWQEALVECLAEILKKDLNHG